MVLRTWMLVTLREFRTKLQPLRFTQREFLQNAKVRSCVDQPGAAYGALHSHKFRLRGGRRIRCWIEP